MRLPFSIFLCLTGLATLLLIGGCSQGGAIRADGVRIQGVPDAGTPASYVSDKAGEKLPLPKGTRIWLRQKDRVPPTGEIPEQPAETTTLIEPGDATTWEKTSSSTKADTGTVDTSVRKHQIDVRDRKTLLYVAIGCLFAGLVLKSMVPKWPGLSNGLLAGGALFGLAWKFSEIPAWVGLVAILAIGFMALGYKRAEWDKNGDGIPDKLQ